MKQDDQTGRRIAGRRPIRNHRRNDADAWLTLATGEVIEGQNAADRTGQACLAMDYAHQQNIIHRDLKPANIIILEQAESDFVKVVDFGLARALPKEGQTSQHLTQTGTLIGSIYYMSPEQCTGKKADARSDIYSLGCILYELSRTLRIAIFRPPTGLRFLRKSPRLNLSWVTRLGPEISSRNRREYFLLDVAPIGITGLCYTRRRRRSKAILS